MVVSPAVATRAAVVGRTGDGVSDAKASKASKASKPAAASVAELLAYALTYPEAWEDNPWGERVAKVGKKVFVFLGVPSEGEVGVSVKLPESADMALSLPFASPTGYGLGKAGWVTARFVKGEEVPHDLIEAWIGESYRAVAPKKLVAGLGAASPEAPKKRARATAAKRKAPPPAAKKPARAK